VLSKAWMIFFFKSAHIFAQEKQIAHPCPLFFSRVAYGFGPPPPPPPPLSPSFFLSFIFKKKTWWVFEAWEEHIQNSNHSLNYFGTYWVQIERFWLQISFFL
jgi:hypothetical protein